MWFILLFGFYTHAADFEARYRYLLARGHSVAEVEKAKADYEKRKVAHAACLIELREKLVPASCYEELNLEAPPKAERRARLARLDRFCARAVQRLSIPLQESTTLSPRCAAEVREAAAIQAYRADDHPEDWSEN